MNRSVLFFSVLLAVAFSFQSFTGASADVDPVGTWTFNAPSAPQGYGNGDIVIAKEKDAYIATLKYGEYAIKGTSVKYEKNVMTFTVYIEGEYIRIKATFSPDGIKGTAGYSEGELDFTAKKKVVKK